MLNFNPMKKQTRQKTKSNLHPRNKHSGQYDFSKLIAVCPELKPFVVINKYKNESINFFDPIAVKLLNKALLKLHYGIDYWEIPEGYLCPPIPGRADYLHYVADLLESTSFNSSIKCLDIGVGANCIYPLIGVQAYGWSFVGSDIDKIAVDNAKKIVTSNSQLKNKIAIRHQPSSNHFIRGVLQADEKFDVLICNPPFHQSAEAAQKATMRKLKNLKNNKITKPVLNFGGQNKELWCVGGEKQFVTNLIHETTNFKSSFKWFTTLISKKIHLGKIYHELENVKVKEVKTIEMGTGNKVSRIVAWRF